MCKESLYEFTVSGEGMEADCRCTIITWPTGHMSGEAPMVKVYVLVCVSTLDASAELKCATILGTGVSS